MKGASGGRRSRRRRKEKEVEVWRRAYRGKVDKGADFPHPSVRFHHFNKLTLVFGRIKGRGREIEMVRRKKEKAKDKQ